jgi:hypothetical protein
LKNRSVRDIITLEHRRLWNYALAVNVPGDYDGDGRSDQAVWRTDSFTFYVNGSMAGFVAFPFGAMNDVPPAWSLQVR